MGSCTNIYYSHSTVPTQNSQRKPGCFVIRQIQYTAFGEIRASLGITDSEYRYTGQLRQAELGLYYYVAHWRDP